MTRTVELVECWLCGKYHEPLRVAGFSILGCPDYNRPEPMMGLSAEWGWVPKKLTVTVNEP
jgi:hypothetical protein